MIPEFEAATGNLPAGEHLATWQELSSRYGSTPWRRRLLDGLLEALRALRNAGYFDACWDAQGVYLDLVDERLLTFDKGRATQKAAFLGELFIADSRADPQGTLFLDFFQTDRDGHRKGIIAIDLKGLP